MSTSGGGICRASASPHLPRRPHLPFQRARLSSTAAGLVLALGSAFALNWGWLVQHGAAGDLPALSLRRPVHSLRLLFGDRAWVAGFGAGVEQAGCSTPPDARGRGRSPSAQATSAGGVGGVAGRASAHRRGDAIHRTGTWVLGLGTAIGGLALIAFSLTGGTTAAARPGIGALTLWLVAFGRA